MVKNSREFCKIWSWKCWKSQFCLPKSFVNLLLGNLLFNKIFKIYKKITVCKDTVLTVSYEIAVITFIYTCAIELQRWKFCHLHLMYSRNQNLLIVFKIGCQPSTRVASLVKINILNRN